MTDVQQLAAMLLGAMAFIIVLILILGLMSHRMGEIEEEFKKVKTEVAELRGAVSATRSGK